MHSLQDHHQMSPKSRPSDINRLLDPSYSSPPRASSSSSAYYVDPHDGDLHDPDYHIFPINLPKPRSSNHTMPPRPRWEDEDALDPEDEDELENTMSHPFYIRRPNSFSSYTYQHHQRRSSNAYSLRTSASGYSFQRTPHHSRVPHYTPHSLDSDDTVLDELDNDNDCGDADLAGSYMLHREKSPCSRIISRTKREFHKRRRSLEQSSSPQDTSPFFPSTPPHPGPLSDVADSDHHHPFTRTFSLQSHGRRSRASCRSEREPFAIPDASFTVEVDGDRDEDAERQRKKKEQQYEWTPTCTQALRMQWQAVALRVRLGLFRTQKRLRRFSLANGRLSP